MSLVGTWKTNEGRRQGRTKALALLATSAALGGCEDDGTVSFVQPDIVVRPPPGTLLEYEEVVLGVSGPATPNILAVANRGTGTLDIDEVGIEGGGADQFRVSSFPRDLAPDGTGEVFVRFEPTLTGTTTAEVVLRSNDPDAPVLRWPLRGPARDPCRLELSPPHQVFILGETRSVEMRAASSHPCEITGISTDASLFSFVDPPALPFTVPAGASRALQIQHSGATVQPGRPIRELRVRESEGTEEIVSLEGEEALYGCLDIGPPDLRFGAIPVDQVGTRYVEVSNRCSESAMVTAANISVGYTYFSVQGTFPLTVGPRQRERIQVDYRPFRTLGDGGELTILTNDAALARYEVELYGEAAPAVIDVFPREVDFGTVAYRNPRGDAQRSECASAGRLVQLFSSGNAPAIVSSLRFDEAGDELFQIASVTVGGRPVDFTQPIRVPPEQEMRISLIFYPTRVTPALHEGTLIIEHNGEQGRTEVRLRGRGGGSGATEDVFNQLPGPKTDILWVIDNSCSMFDEQARLQQNLGQFVGYADGIDSDYQMAVTTTDHQSPNAGEFQRCFPHPSIVSSDYADTATRDAAFRCMFDVGINGPQEEGGFGAAKRALELAQDPDAPNNPNVGFLRDDANLSIIIVSDENDTTSLSEDVLYNFFISVKDRRNPERVRVHAIARPTTDLRDCENEFPNTQGRLYSGLVRRMNGLYQSICLDDWQPVLRDLGLNVFTPLDEWALSRQADPATITVLVDGVPVRNDPAEGWTFDRIGNSVEFHGASVPAPGAEIRVSYQGLCRP